MSSCFHSKVIQVFLAANSTWTYYRTNSGTIFPYVIIPIDPAPFQPYTCDTAVFHMHYLMHNYSLECITNSAGFVMWRQLSPLNAITKYRERGQDCFLRFKKKSIWCYHVISLLYVVEVYTSYAKIEPIREGYVFVCFLLSKNRDRNFFSTKNFQGAEHQSFFCWLQISNTQNRKHEAYRESYSISEKYG